MAKRRKQKSDPQEVRKEMLRHLAEHPPSAETPAPEQAKMRSRRTARSENPSPPRPRLMLRKMPLDLALSRLHGFLIAKQALGTQELIVVVGKGRGSPDGIPVLAPAVRGWLEEHPELVAGFEEAPLREGGAGALLVRLRPRS